MSPSDEFASFEILSYLLGDPQGRIPHIFGSYVRQALKDGLAMQDTKGFNPFKFGFGAASDSHNTAVPYRQSNFFGGHAKRDGDIKARMSGKLDTGMDPRATGPAGLTGVWAEENTRAAIFEAMQRKETFAVSGPHIQVRFFGGWDYAADAQSNSVPDWIKDRSWVKAAYDSGVPMGGDLPPPPAGKTAPSFAVWAVKDPTSGNLDRIQIVKGWSKHGQSFEKVFDVAWAGDRVPEKWTGRGAAGRQHRGHRQRHLHQHHRRRRAQGRVGRSRVRSEPARVLLRPRAGNPDAALDHDPGQAARHRAARCRAPYPAGARMELAHLVHAERRGPQSRHARTDRERSQEEGSGPAQRFAIAGADREQVDMAAE